METILEKQPRFLLFVMGTRNKLKSIILDNYQMQETTDFENRRDKS